MADTKIIVRLNGSLWVEGPFDLVDQEGERLCHPRRGTGGPVPVRSLQYQALLRPDSPERRASFRRSYQGNLALDSGLRGGPARRAGRPGTRP